MARTDLLPPPQNDRLDPPSDRAEQGQSTGREGAGKAARAEQGQGHDQRTETRQGRIRTGAEDRAGTGQDRGRGRGRGRAGQGRVG